MDTSQLAYSPELQVSHFCKTFCGTLIQRVKMSKGRSKCCLMHTLMLLPPISEGSVFLYGLSLAGQSSPSPWSVVRLLLKAMHYLAASHTLWESSLGLMSPAGAGSAAGVCH